MEVFSGCRDLLRVWMEPFSNTSITSFTRTVGGARAVLYTRLTLNESRHAWRTRLRTRAFAATKERFKLLNLPNLGLSDATLYCYICIKILRYWCTSLHERVEDWLARSHQYTQLSGTWVHHELVFCTCTPQLTLCSLIDLRYYSRSQRTYFFGK